MQNIDVDGETLVKIRSDEYIYDILSTAYFFLVNKFHPAAEQ